VLTTRHGVRPLGGADVDAFLELCMRDPVVNVFADHRARTTNLEPRWLGGEVWGRFDGGFLVAACHVGANLVPIEASADDARAFAERALTRNRSVSTIVGPHEASTPLVEPAAGVRRTTRSDLEQLYPACVAMYTEEVGVSPELGGGADLYRARVQQLISRGWSFAWFDDDQLVFKAEVACASPYAAQIQGVYVPPERRGEGLATAGMAAVAEIVRAEIAPRVSLYVNDWNTSARRAYERVGFKETTRFSTVMF
jgi:uncharacterized protein